MGRSGQLNCKCVVIGEFLEVKADGQAEVFRSRDPSCTAAYQVKRTGYPGTLLIRSCACPPVFDVVAAYFGWPLGAVHRSPGRESQRIGGEDAGDARRTSAGGPRARRGVRGKHRRSYRLVKFGLCYMPLMPEQD